MAAVAGVSAGACEDRARCVCQPAEGHLGNNQEPPHRTMKEKLGSLIQTAAAGLGGAGTLLAGKDLIAPDDIDKVNAAGGSIATALGIILAAIIVHVIGARIKKSGGTPGGMPAITLTTAAALSLAGFALPSCSVVGSAVTGAPIPATAVQRTGGGDAEPVLIASTDLAQAEAEARVAREAGQAPPVNGLYDAGRAAKAVREVFTESSK